MPTEAHRIFGVVGRSINFRALFRVCSNGGQRFRPDCSLVDSVEALGTLVTVDAEIRTDSELESSYVCRIISKHNHSFNENNR